MFIRGESEYSDYVKSKYSLVFGRILGKNWNNREKEEHFSGNFLWTNLWMM